MAGQMSTSGRGRGSGGFYVTWDNVASVQRVMNDIEDSLRKQMNGELRTAAKQIADDEVIPELIRSAGASGVPIAPKMAATARAKSDRMVMVQIGGVNPKLSGFKAYKRSKGKKLKSGRDATSKNYRTTLAWGSDRGPYPGSTVNHYAVGRSSSWWVQAGVNAALPAAVTRYRKALDVILAKGSRYR